jgi:hypothetical protein
MLITILNIVDASPLSRGHEEEVEMWKTLWSGLALAALALGGPAPALAQSDRERAQADEIAELRRDMKVVVEELQSLRTQMGVPEEKTLEASRGLGPAASKVYDVGQGLSIGGYAEAVYRNRSSDADGDGEDFADFTRAVLYVGYKYNDWIVYNMELEFEHASTGEDGSVSVEFAALDFLFDDSFNARAGLVLIPMGFLNEVHEPPFYYGTQRPEAERRIIPSTWRENGVGFYGSWDERFHYRAYVVNGMDASGYSASGLRGGRQKGSEALAEDLAVVARLDIDVTPELMFGGSYYVGNAGQDQRYTQEGSGTTFKLPKTRTQIWELHADWRYQGWKARTLYTQAHIGDAGKLSKILDDPTDATSKAVAQRMIGGYAEVGYDVMPLWNPDSEYELDLFFRYEYVDTQNEIPGSFERDRSQPRKLFIPGIHFKPHPEVVLKLDYRNIENWEGESSDEISLGLGLVF